MKPLYVGVNIDWSKSFVDPNGGFYCGTTDEQKALAAELMPALDLVVNTTDFHSVKSNEFAANGGMWPYHNVAEFQTLDVTTLGLEKETTISPEQTEIIDSAINKTKTGIVVPRHVYYQDGSEIAFAPELVEQAFGHNIITPEQFMQEDYTYIIAPKTHFDASMIVSPRSMPRDSTPGIPDDEYTVFELIEEKYGQTREVVYIGTGVVDNICRHYTTTGLRQKYGHRVINVVGATTELYGIGLGFEEKQQTREACERMQRDIGIEHKTLEETLQEIRERRA